MIVDIGQSLDEERPLLVCKVDKIGRALVLAHNLTVLALGVNGLHPDEVHNTLELLLGSDGDLNGGSGDLELLVDALDGLPGVGTGAVHLVDEADTRDVVALHLPIDGDGLRLHARHGAEDHDCAVQHSQGTLDLDGEVNVAGSVDQVDVVFLVLHLAGDGVGGLLDPVAEGGGRLDGDALFPLQVHAVHLCADCIFSADLVNVLDTAGVEQHALGDGRLSRVNVGGDTDVPDLVQTGGLLGVQVLNDRVLSETGGILGGGFLDGSSSCVPSSCLVLESVWC